MAIDNNNKFLNYEGLQKLWSLIGNKFSTKDSTLSSISMTADSSGINIGTLKADGTAGNSFSLPIASETAAGIITPEIFGKIEAVAGDITTAIKVNDIQIGGGNVNDTEFPYTSIVDNNKVAKFGLKYTVDSSNNAFISLATQDGQELSKIDVTALIRTGLIKNDGVDLIVNPEGQQPGTYLMITFLTADSGTKTIYLNVTDLIDIYAQGDGIEITDGGTSGIDGVESAKTINLKLAADNQIGGIKLGYTANGKNYPIEIDESGKAFVNVPWINISVGITGDDYIDANGSIGSDGIGSFNISATDSLKIAIGKAESAIQIAEGEKGDNALITADSSGNKITVATTSKLQTAVAKAESAIQTVTDNSVLLEIDTDGNKVTITDSSKLTGAVEKAETAMQSVNVLGTTLKDGEALSVDAAKTALGLKSAAYVDVANSIESEEDKEKLITAGEVKTYVDSKTGTDIGGLETKLQGYVNGLIDNIDASINLEAGLITSVTQENGKITSIGVRKPDISDIENFAALTTEEISDICK